MKAVAFARKRLWARCPSLRRKMYPLKRAWILVALRALSMATLRSRIICMSSLPDPGEVAIRLTDLSSGEDALRFICNSWFF